MSLRKKAAEMSKPRCMVWHSKINKKQKADLLDLFEGYKQNEFTVSSAYKAFIQEYPEIKISRSAFGTAFRGFAENDA